MADSSASSYSTGRMKISLHLIPVQHLSTSLGLSVTSHLEGTTSGIRESSTQSRSLSTSCSVSKLCRPLAQVACQNLTHRLVGPRCFNSPSAESRSKSMRFC